MTIRIQILQNALLTTIVTLCCACSTGNDSLVVFEPLDLGSYIQAVPAHSYLAEPDYYVWGGSMERTADGKCHLLYARWPKEKGFQGWLKTSEIAYATADNPTGPYTFQKVILKGFGKGNWNEESAHNPHIKKFGDKYYLYFISHRKEDLGLSDWMNHIFTQRIGVATADHPTGPWTVLPEPIIDYQEGKAANGYMVNPSVTQRPDGSYLMMFKSRPPNAEKSKEFKTIHCIATSDSPTGPFSIAEKPILTKATAEDPYVWYQRDRYYSLVKDMYAQYTGHKSLALFESFDGFDWQPSKHIMVAKTEIIWESGDTTALRNLERPQLWFNEKGEPSMLFAAAWVKGQSDSLTFNVHIPLSKSQSH